MICLVISVILAIALSLLGFFTNPVFAHEPGHHHATPSSTNLKAVAPEAAAFAQAMEAGMEKMMMDMSRTGMTGNPDVDFLAMMIPHHQGAIEISRLVLIYGADPLVRQLAEEIITSQQVEVAAMQARLTLKPSANPNPDGFPAIAGIRGD